MTGRLVGREGRRREPPVCLLCRPPQQVDDLEEHVARYHPDGRASRWSVKTKEEPCSPSES